MSEDGNVPGNAAADWMTQDSPLCRPKRSASFRLSRTLSPQSCEKESCLGRNQHQEILLAISRPKPHVRSLDTLDPVTRLNAALEGRYRIERELGEGGMATVYLAKVLKPELAAVVGAEHFLAEIETTAKSGERRVDVVEQFARLYGKPLSFFLQ
jgi:hypothetical protein